MDYSIILKKMAWHISETWCVGSSMLEKHTSAFYVDLSKTLDAFANTNISDSPFFRCLWYQSPITVHTPDEQIFAYWGALGIILIYNCNDRHGPFTWNMCIQNKFNNSNTKSSNGKPARMRELFTHVACKICACGLMCKMFRICEWVCVVARAL